MWLRTPEGGNTMRLFPREHYLQRIRGFYDADDIIKVITGVRRCGKSCLMAVIREELHSKGVPEKNILSIDLDRRENRNIKTPGQLEDLILQKGTATGLKYLFIDEVQNVDSFEEVLNGFRGEGNWSIFVTGSNSYLLSGELITKLTGRYLTFEVFPLSFDEYVAMKRFYDLPVEPTLTQELSHFITDGGFPRTIFLDNPQDKRTYVQGIVQEIFEKDIRCRVKIREKGTFEAVRTYLLNNFAALTSIRNLYNALNANGTPVSRNTLSRYIQILLDAKILMECPRFDMKSKRSLNGEKKYYLADLGFHFSQNTYNRINYGPVLENIVYTYARAHGYSVSVGRIGKLECDFILRSTTMQYSYVQVSYTIALSKETEDREFRPLEIIQDNYPKYVATLDPLLQERSGIRHVNIADFMGTGQLF